tara:strand:+ start:2557 stop:3714 length:1158 start_codon:yes stop_codon:yes gene_type:complete
MSEEKYKNYGSDSVNQMANHILAGDIERINKWTSAATSLGIVEKYSTKEEPEKKSTKGSIKNKSDNSLLGKLFKLVWDTINNNGLPFEVLTNIELYKKSIINEDFITSFVKALNNNVIIVPIKIVNITNLNLTSYNHNGHAIDAAIRVELGFRMYVSFFLPSLDPDQTNMYYDKDHIYLELNSGNPSYKSVRKEILDSFKDLDIEMEQVSDTLDNLVKTNPEYHKMVYDRNKAIINLNLLKSKINDLNDKIYKLESGVLPDNLIEENRDKFKRKRVKLFNAFLENTSKPRVTIVNPETSGSNLYGNYSTPPFPEYFLDDADDFNTSSLESASYEDYIDYDNGVYFDFDGNSYEIDNLNLEKLDYLLEQDLMSLESSDSIIAFRGL